MNLVLITKLGFFSLQVHLNYPDLVIKWAYHCWSHLVYSLLLHLSLSLSLSVLFLVSTLDSCVFCVCCSCFRWFCVVCHTHRPTKAFLFKLCSLVFGYLSRWWSGFLELWLLGFLWDLGRGNHRWGGGFRVGGGGGGCGVSGRRRKRRRRGRGWGGCGG